MGGGAVRIWGLGSESMRIVDAFKNIFTRTGRWTGLIIAAVAVAISAPSLFAGFVIDDHFFRALFQGFPGIDGVPMAMTNTFVFGDGVPAHNLARMNESLLPWWTPPDWKVGFWRPLSSWSHWLDFQLYGDHAFWMHLESVLLYALIAYGLYRLYTRTLGVGWVAGLAALLYAIDDTHGIPVTWISNRNTVFATLFAVLTLLFHDRWRRGHSRWGLVCALGFLTLGLLSGEGAVAVGGYLAAHALFLDEGTPMRRFVRLLPYLAVVIVWRAIYSGLGFGIAKAAIYTDPGGHPLRFLVDIVLYFPVLMLCQFAQPDPSAIWMFVTPLWQFLFWVAATLYIAVVGWCLWPILRVNKAARFWALGMVLSVVPSCATLPQARLLMIPGMGAMALVALLLHRWHERVDRRKTVRVVAGLFVLFHLILAPMLFLITGNGMRAMEGVFRDSSASLDMIEGLESKHVVVLNTVSDLNLVGIPVLRSSMGAPMPDLTTVLYAGVADVYVERLDDRTLVLRPEGGFMPRPWGQIFVDPRDLELAPGDRVELDGLTIEILEVLPDHRPSAVKFMFDVPLESPHLAIVQWERGRYVPAELPEPGGTTVAVGTSPVHLVGDAMFGRPPAD